MKDFFFLVINERHLEWYSIDTYSHLVIFSLKTMFKEKEKKMFVSIGHF